MDMEGVVHHRFFQYKKDPCREAQIFFLGADEGSRTLLSSLGSSRSTDELHPHEVYEYHSIFFFQFLLFFQIPAV